MLKLHNTLTKKKDIFNPITPSHIKMYVCGPTVYDNIHIGNARPIVVFDTLFRLLQTIYPKVTYVRNITDIDDKILIRATENNESISSLTKRMTQSFHEDIAKINALPPTHEPKVTEHISGIINIINNLIKNNTAYVIEGHVFFHVPAFKNYGKLSGLSVDELIAGSRIEVSSLKKHPSDFVLWKPSKENEIGWESCWSYGRPGWHIECSAMSHHFLGDNFDIHGGGQDLIFPHHENEIAQSVCSFPNSHFANYWLHNGFLMVEGEKMSKSLGNFITLKDALSKHHGETIRLTLLKTHYRQPLDFKEESLQQSKKILDNIYHTLLITLQALRVTLLNDKDIHSSTNLKTPAITQFLNLLNDDLNTHEAIAYLQNHCKLLRNLIVHYNKSLETPTDSTDPKQYIQEIMFMGNILGILQYQNPNDWFLYHKKGTKLSSTEIEELIRQRDQAKQNKNYKKADEIRDYLKSHNIELKDNKNGKTTWETI